MIEDFWLLIKKNHCKVNILVNLACVFLNRVNLNTSLGRGRLSSLNFRASAEFEDASQRSQSFVDVAV